MFLRQTLQVPNDRAQETTSLHHVIPISGSRASNLCASFLKAGQLVTIQASDSPFKREFGNDLQWCIPTFEIKVLKALSYIDVSLYLVDFKTLKGD